MQNRTFYEWGSLGEASAQTCERAFPPLDIPAAAAGRESYVGISSLNDIVRFSRPASWKLRDCSDARGRRYVQYVSHNQYVVALWERTDLEADLWQDVLHRYEDDVKGAGAQILGGPVPIATWNAQGRHYLIKRAVPAPKTALVGQTREFVLRGDAKLVLVQINIPEAEVPELATELMPFMTSLRVQ